MNFLALLLAFFLGAQGPTLGMIGTHPSASAPPITRVEIQTTNGSCSGGLSINLGTATTAGELIGAAYIGGSTSGNTASFSDNLSSSYTKDGEITGLGTHGTFGFFHLANASSGINKVTLTLNESTCALIVAHYKNLAASPLDQNTGNPTSSGAQTFPYTFTSGTKTTTSNNELLIGAVGCQASPHSCTIAGTGIWPATVAALENVNTGAPAVAYQELIVSSIQTGIANTGTASNTGTADTGYLAPMLITFHQ